MSGSECNVTSATDEPNVMVGSREEILKIFEVVEIILLVIEVWIFISMIVYGTKTRRWRKTAQTSSLNNGLIFIACAMTLLAYILRLAASLATYKAPGFKKDSCEFVFDFASGAFVLSAWGSYVFLWARQRIIYNHPYVKPRVGKWVNLLSISTVLLLTLDALGIGFTRITPKSYHNGTVGCIYEEQDDGSAPPDVQVISLLAFLLLAQLLIAALFVYPATKVLLQRHNQTNFGDAQVSSQNDASKRPTWLTMLICGGRSNAPTSPVQMSVRRTMGCSFVMVITDVLITTIVLPIDLSGTPSVSETIRDFGIVVHAVCIVMTFGFSSSVFTLFWPKCRERVQSKTPLHAEQESDPSSKTEKKIETNQTSNA